MGLVPGDDYDEGLQCPTCFDLNNPVGWRITPDVVQLTLSGVTTCPGVVVNPNGVHLMTQIGACAWFKGTIDFLYDFIIAGGGPPVVFSLLKVFNLANNKGAFINTGSLCDTSFTNDYGPGDCGVAVSHHSGTGVIAWGPGIGP